MLSHPVPSLRHCSHPRPVKVTTYKHHWWICPDCGNAASRHRAWQWLFWFPHPVIVPHLPALMVRPDAYFDPMVREGHREYSKEHALRFVKTYAEPSGLDLTGKTSWQELAALLADERVKTLVSSDSGPVHIAWILGKPVVALYARGVPGSDPVRWGPRGGRSRVIFKPMNEIKTDEVLQKLEEVLAT